MHITSVTPFSPGDESAIVAVSDGTYTCWAFCWPCDLKEGALLDEPLALFDESKLMLSSETEFRLDRVNTSGLRHYGIARVVDAERGLVRVGDLSLTVGGWLPGGIAAGDMIEFECARIDIG